MSNPKDCVVTDTQSRIDHLIVDLRAAASLGRAITVDEVDDIEKRLSAALAEARAAQSGEWVMVPRALNQNQRLTAFRYTGDDATTELLWGVLLAAAPPAPAAEPVAWEFRWLNPANDPNVSPKSLEWKLVVASDSRETVKDRVSELRSYRWVDDKPIYEVRPLYTAPPPVSVSAKPVAWQARFRGEDGWGPWWDCRERDLEVYAELPNWETRALGVIAPPPVSVRCAVEREQCSAIPMPVPLVWSEIDTANMRDVCQRFGEPQPRTETLMAVAAVGYRKALGLAPAINLSAPPPVEASQCPGEWEPGCDLGANAKFARRVDEVSDDYAAGYLAGWRSAKRGDSEPPAILRGLSESLGAISGTALAELSRLTAELSAAKAEAEAMREVVRCLRAILPDERWADDAKRMANAAIAAQQGEKP